jgi:hypothetical protein
MVGVVPPGLGSYFLGLPRTSGCRLGEHPYMHRSFVGSPPLPQDDSGLGAFRGPFDFAQGRPLKRRSSTSLHALIAALGTLRHQNPNTQRKSLAAAGDVASYVSTTGSCALSGFGIKVKIRIKVKGDGQECPSHTVQI